MVLADVWGETGVRRRAGAYRRCHIAPPTRDSHHAPARGCRGDMKRFVDFVVSAGAMLLLSPVLLIVAIVVRLSLGAPVLFRQQRPGLHGKPFVIYKFRTMRDATDSSGRPLPDAKRM